MKWCHSRKIIALAVLGIIQSGSARSGVVLLHGLCRSAESMEPMAQALRDSGYVVKNIDYPSRVFPIADLSEMTVGAALASPELMRMDTLHFVTHSLGGILVRQYFNTHEEPRLGRVVMLGPPNGGSEVVDNMKEWSFFQWLNGPAGSELGTDAAAVPNTLGPVHFELGVIAGDISINWINSLMIPGPDDGKVSVERSKVQGQKEHLVLSVLHPTMMKDPDVIRYTISFLRTGSFHAIKTSP